MADVDSTPVIHGTGIARANLEWDPEAKQKLLDRDWRDAPIPYEVPPELVLPRLPSTPGPPNRCTEALARRIEALILKGASLPAARNACNVSRNDWAEWMRRAADGKEPFVQMRDRMKFCLAHKEMHATQIIMAASQHPDAAIATANAEKIARWTNPKLYGQTKQTVDVRHSGTVGVDVRAVAAIAALDPATVAAMFAAPTAAPLLESTVPTPLLGRGGDDDEGSP